MRYNKNMNKVLISIMLTLGIITPAFLYAQETTTTNVEVELSQEEQGELLDQLVGLITQLKQAIAEKKSELAGNNACPRFTRSLFANKTGQDVAELQAFLLTQGVTIYPEAKITGTYGSATVQAVQRFQVQNNIASPGAQGYGVTGPATQAFIAKSCRGDFIVPNTIISTGNNSNISISGSLSRDTNAQLENSTLFNPNSDSVFLQYLNPTTLQSNTAVVGENQTSPSSKTIFFTNTPTNMIVGSTHTLEFSQNGFAGFDLITIEGYKDDIRYFFGTAVPALGSYQITIPAVFKNKDSFTLLIKHNGVIKTSKTISIGTRSQTTIE